MARDPLPPIRADLLWHVYDAMSEADLRAMRVGFALVLQGLELEQGVTNDPAVAAAIAGCRVRLAVIDALLVDRI